MLDTAPPSLLTMPPALEDTLVRPSDALDVACEVFGLTEPVASGMVDALRRPARRAANGECRSTARDAAKDIVKTGAEGRCRRRL